MNEWILAFSQWLWQHTFNQQGSAVILYAGTRFNFRLHWSSQPQLYAFSIWIGAERQIQLLLGALCCYCSEIISMHYRERRSVSFGLLSDWHLEQNAQLCTTTVRHPLCFNWQEVHYMLTTGLLLKHIFTDICQCFHLRQFWPSVWLLIYCWIHLIVKKVL